MGFCCQSSDHSRGSPSLVAENHMAKILMSWSKVAALDSSLETQGVMVFKNIFEIAPGAL